MTDLKTLYHNEGGTKLVSSAISNYYRSNIAENASVKIVLEGKEHYKINGRPYTLEKDHFLIHDKDELVETNVQTSAATKGICLFLDQRVLEELIFQKTSSLEQSLDNPSGLKEFKFTHGVYSLKAGRTGYFLNQNLNSSLLKSEDQSNEAYEQFFYGLSESLISDQLEVQDALDNINTVKKATKEELFRRVFKVKALIDENYKQNISLDEMAAEALLSKFHFVRTFKQMFNSSPYQYLIQKRVNLAFELLEKDYSYSETSLMAGFPDVRNMRRILKKHKAN